MIPTGWKQIRLGDVFENRKQRGERGLPTLSVTISSGVVDRDQLERKTDSTLAPEEHLLVEPGDIAYNTMRMWQGAAGLIDTRANVSPAYVVLKPTSGIDSRFASYLFKTQRMIHLFWAYSHGLTDDRRRLYYDDFAAIPALLPPLSEQKNIADILGTWDQNIANSQRIASTSELHWQTVANLLLNGRIRIPGEWQPWRTIRLSGIGSFRKGRGILKADVATSGIPAIRYGEIYTTHHFVVRRFQSFISPETAAQSERLHRGDILFTCSGETAAEIGKCVAFNSDIEAYAGGDLIILRDHGQSARFLGYALNSPTVTRQKTQLGQGNSVVHIGADSLGSLKFSLPSHEEQEAIADVLDAGQDLIVRLRARTEGLATERKALLQQLLTGKRRVSTKKVAA